MKTDYVSHDELYKRKKSEGWLGWSKAEDTEGITRREKALQAEYVPKNGKLLELGCGAGDQILWFSDKGYEAYGVDIAPTAIAWAIEKAEERNLEADFRVGNVLELKDYQDNFFDIVLDGACFHCIIGEDRTHFLVSAKRVLKPEGIFFIQTMCAEKITDKMIKYYDMDPQSRCQIKDGLAVRYVGRAEDILSEIREAGFHILDWKIETLESTKEKDPAELLFVYAQKT
jgi:ubiquinone/menaquinone biosynthesis C-methylase UbiE